MNGNGGFCVTHSGHDKTCCAASNCDKVVQGSGLCALHQLLPLLPTTADDVPVVIGTLPVGMPGMAVPAIGAMEIPVPLITSSMISGGSGALIPSGMIPGASLIPQMGFKPPVAQLMSPKVVIRQGDGMNGPDSNAEESPMGAALGVMHDSGTNTADTQKDIGMSGVKPPEPLPSNAILDTTTAQFSPMLHLIQNPRGMYNAMDGMAPMPGLMGLSPIRHSVAGASHHNVGSIPKGPTHSFRHDLAAVSAVGGTADASGVCVMPANTDTPSIDGLPLAALSHMIELDDFCRYFGGPSSPPYRITSPLSSPSPASKLAQ